MLERDALVGHARVAPAARERGERAGIGAVAALDPERGELRGALELVVGELERARRRDALDEVGGGVAGEELRRAQHRDEEVAVRGDAAEVQALEREREPARGLAARRRVRDHLGEHRVEVGADPRARRRRPRPSAPRASAAGSNAASVPVAGRKSFAGSSA